MCGYEWWRCCVFLFMLLSDFFAMILSSGEGFKFCGSFRFPSSSSCSSLDSHMYVCMYVHCCCTSWPWLECVYQRSWICALREDERSLQKSSSGAVDCVRWDLRNERLRVRVRVFRCLQRLLSMLYIHKTFQFLFLTHPMLAGYAAGFHEGLDLLISPSCHQTSCLSHSTNAVFILPAAASWSFKGNSSFWISFLFKNACWKPLPKSFLVVLLINNRP